ncbi:MAG: TMEM175 family protein [Actinomycetota bacterium]
MLDQGQKRQRYERQHDPARVLTLTDGVFAIVVTLLVLEIHVPDLAGGQSLRAALREVRPSFIAFLISFVVIAIAWAGHRDLFALIRRTDRSLVWLNFVYLLPVSLLPFGAALISRYEHESVALSLYGVLLLLIALTRLVVWLYATNRPHLLYESIDRRVKTIGILIVAVPAALYVLAIGLADSAPDASLAIYVATPILYFVIAFVSRSIAPPGEADEFT